MTTPHCLACRGQPLAIDHHGILRECPECRGGRKLSELVACLTAMVTAQRRRLVQVRAQLDQARAAVREGTLSPEDVRDARLAEAVVWAAIRWADQVACSCRRADVCPDCHLVTLVRALKKRLRR